MATRRDFLKLAAMLSGAAGVSGFVPESIARAYAIAPEPGTTWRDAEHVVILMQENRSFDHVFGTLRGVRGYNDPRALRLPNGNTIFVQTDQEGQSYAPWRLDIRDTRITWMGSIPHTRNSQVDAWNEGQSNQWLDAKRSDNPDYAKIPMTMGHYTREDLPFYYALADAFTVCDQNYCGVMTSTTPNRSSFWTGTVRNPKTYFAGQESRVYMRNWEYMRGGMDWKTYPERLTEAGVPWKLYQNEVMNSGLSDDKAPWLGNFGCNLPEFFAAYNIAAYPGFVVAQQQQIAQYREQIADIDHKLMGLNSAEQIADLQKQLEEAQSGIYQCEALLAKSGPALYEQLSPEQKTLFDSAFVTNAGDPDYHELDSLSFAYNGQQKVMTVPKGDVLYQFRKDVQTGKLPAVSWLTAPENFSDHPVSAWYGAWYVSEVMDILTQNPEVWKKTIFILTYDENDGYFDHAPSFVAADPKRSWTGGASAGIDTGVEYTYQPDELIQGVAEQEARSGPIGLGFRVPMVIASPWTRGGWVNSQLFEHTSTLRFLEQFVEQKFGKQVRETNISDWRRAATGDLTSVFRTYDPEDAKLDYVNRDPFLIEIQEAQYKELPANYKALSAAEIAAINRGPMQSTLTSHQEPGTRRSCPIPYELYADVVRTPDGKSLTLAMKAGALLHGARAAGSPFNVYLRNLRPGVEGAAEGMRAATYLVRAGDTLEQSWPLSLFAEGSYEVEVHGPNGFYRSFTGSAKQPPLAVHLEYELEGGKITGNLRVHLRNNGQQRLRVALEDCSYQAKPIRRTLDPQASEVVLVDLKKSRQWYDVKVQAEGHTAQSRFAGRVETGRAGWSDPKMAGLLEA